jgi:hypothetical protein
MTIADSTYSPLHSSVCYDASNIAESTTNASRGRQDSSSSTPLAPFRAFTWNSGAAIVGFAIQVVSIYASVLSVLVDQGALKEQDFCATVLRWWLARLDVLVYLGIMCSFVWVDFRHDSPWRRKSIFYLFMNALIGLGFGTFLSFIVITGAVNMSLPTTATETLFPLSCSCALCCFVIAVNDWREDEKDKINGDESDLERPLIV